MNYVYYNELLFVKRANVSTGKVLGNDKKLHVHMCPFNKNQKKKFYTPAIINNTCVLLTRMMNLHTKNRKPK